MLLNSTAYLPFIVPLNTLLTILSEEIMSMSGYSGRSLPPQPKKGECSWMVDYNTRCCASAEFEVKVEYNNPGLYSSWDKEPKEICAKHLSSYLHVLCMSLGNSLTGLKSFTVQRIPPQK